MRRGVESKEITSRTHRDESTLNATPANGIESLKMSWQCAFHFTVSLSDWHKIGICAQLRTPFSPRDKTNPAFISFNFLLWHFHNLFSFKLISFKSTAPRGERCKYTRNFSSPGIYLQTPQYQENTKRGNRLFLVTQLQLLMKTPLSASPRN